MKTSKQISNVIPCNLNNLIFRSKQHRKLSNCLNYTSIHHISSHDSSSIIDNELNEEHQIINPALQFIQSQGLREIHDYKLRTYHTKNKQVIQLRECPLCPPHKNDITNLWTLGIFIDIGSYNCFRCGNHGDWSSLIKIFNTYGTQCGDAFNDVWNGYNIDIDIDNEESEICEISRNEHISEKQINFENELLFSEKPLLNRLIKERNLSSKCFKDYKCGLKYKYFRNFKQKQQCITFPMYQYNINENKFEATKYKTRCISNNIKTFDQYPTLNEGGLFGFDSNGNENNKIVITEGEYDSMAIYFATKYKIKPISLANGANNISNKMIKQLSHFYDEFILWTDWDIVGQQNANNLKQKIRDQIDGKHIDIKIIENKDKLENIKDANDILIKYENNGHEIINNIMHQYKVQ